MPRRIIRTTRKIQYNEDGEPIQTVVSSTQEQPAVEQPAEQTEVYEPPRGLERVTYTYAPPTQPVQQVVSTELVEPQWSRTLRRVTERQMQILRNLDLRLANLESADERAAENPSFERATWWALWGILMLILGAALVVILLLILTGIPH